MLIRIWPLRVLKRPGGRLEGLYNIKNTDMAVTIKDVAREAKVSVGLVSMVLNGREGVNKATSEHVLSVIERLGYKPNKAAASLRSGRKKMIGVITPDLSNHYFSEISRHIENIAYAKGYTVLFASSDDSAEKVGDMIDSFEANGLGGLIITPCFGVDEHLKRALRNGQKVVLMNRDVPAIEGVGRVCPDNSKGLEMAVNHLLSSGRTHIEMLSNTDTNQNLKDRESHFRKMINSLGMSSSARINYVSEKCTVEELLPLVSQAHARGVDALLVSRGRMTLMVLKAIRKLGLRVPEDMAVLGFDIGEMHAVTSPEITQISHDTYVTAYKSFNMLCSMLDGAEPDMIILEPELIVCGSTAPVLSEKHRIDVLLPGSLFSHKGGWTVDQQFMDQCGSTVLLAHGLGRPVDDASTSFFISREGTYRFWVRTRNWTARWSGKATPGCFKVAFDGTVNTDSEGKDILFGTESSEWHWQEGADLHLREGLHTVKVMDQQGFDARFDSIFLSKLSEKDSSYSFPSDDMAEMRKKFLSQPHIPENKGHFDLVVAGGGVAGMCAAISAARQGLKVALVQDRRVLGGNNSSEVRVGLGGRLNIGRYPSLGYLLNEFGPSSKGNARSFEVYEDDKKLKAVLDEKNITLLLGYHVTGVEKNADRITALTATDVENYTQIRITGDLFSDCTGDAVLGVLAGADWRMGREARSTYSEPSAPECGDGRTLGASMQWCSREEEAPVSFPDIEWGLELDENTAQKVRRGQWYWEVGMDDDQIADAERIRDYGMYVAYSNWSFLKNRASCKAEYENLSLEWLCSVTGKRESRRLLGDVVLTENDLVNFVQYPDGCVSTSWYIDDHEPDPQNAARFREPWLSRGLLKPLGFYPLPYRLLYSRNISNLFMAGRNISVSHLALGTTRVMRTCAMMGEVVGLAASVCRVFSVLPRDVYEKYWGELDMLMKKGAGRTDMPYMQVYTLVDTTAERREDC